MHAYFPALNSFPSLLGDMLADAIGCLGFTWVTNTSCILFGFFMFGWGADDWEEENNTTED